MDIKEIKQIIDLVKRSDLAEFEIREENFRLRIVRNNGATFPVVAPAIATHTAAVPQPSAAATAPQEAAPADDKSIGYIKSPMVGTFYRAPSPESPVFVEDGANVAPDTVVCIIEAMKVMNEIQSEVKGKIIECLVENGTPVEFGQPLFKVKLS